MTGAARYRATREWAAGLRYDVWAGDGHIIAYAVPWDTAYALKEAHASHGARITVATLAAPSPGCAQHCACAQNGRACCYCGGTS